MAEFLPFTERYLLRLIYYTASQPPASASGQDLWYETHTALVRVTNTGDKQMSKRNLESLSLSIPELNHRVMGYRDVPMLLHPILLWEENLPLDCCLPQRTRAQLPSRSYNQPVPHIAEYTLPQLLDPSDDNSYFASDSLSCDSSFTAGLIQEEWCTVTYGDHDFIRSICPVYCTDDEEDVIGRCCVSDYNAYGQLVLSVELSICKQAGR